MPVPLLLDRLSKSYGPTIAVHDVSMTVAAGEFIALLGPSGCGKTTTLRMVAGFVQPTSGAIRLGERDITRMPPNRRDIGMVFQSYALFPHMNVARNVEFGLKCHGVSGSELRRRTAEALEKVDLAHLSDRLPRALSGGQQQRVALARVLALKPALLLFDEPLSNLDAKLRLQMREEIRSLQRDVGITALFVTHDQDEAMAIADRIVVMHAGRIEQVGSAQDIYDHPRSRFVAEFIGTSNMLEGEYRPGHAGGYFRTRLGLDIPAAYDARSNLPGVLTLRPEKIDLAPDMPGPGVPGRVVSATNLGATMEYLVALASGDALRVSDIRRGERRTWSHGEAIRAIWRPQDVMVIPDEPHRGARSRGENA